MNAQYNPGDIVLGNWTLLELIGEGSYGYVYMAERHENKRKYQSAIKIITIPKSQSEIISAMSDGMDEDSVTAYFHTFVDELVDEMALMSKLKGNSSIVSYEDHMVIQRTDRIGWDIIIRMELLTPLLNYIIAERLTKKDVMQLGIDMCNALELCQKYNIVHRDIKPENIFVAENGNFKLGDFGIARTVEKTASGLSRKGTYSYMAPEIYRGEAYGSGVDIYSLGLVLYRLLNDNRSPFLPNYPEQINYYDQEVARTKRFSGEKIPTPAHADGRLAEIVLKACSFDPKDRYSSPMQMREELEAITYDKKEAQVIFPIGDEVPVKENESEEVSETIQEKTVYDDKLLTIESKTSSKWSFKKKLLFIIPTAAVIVCTMFALFYFSDYKTSTLQYEPNDKTIGIKSSAEDNSEVNDVDPPDLFENVSHDLDITIDLTDEGITDEILVDMIMSGEIPKNTTVLILVSNNIRDVTPLQSLTNLTVLVLEDNQVIDISPLQPLTNLTELYLSDNPISDIMPLQSLANLTGLGLNNNHISDITSLQSLTNLTWLGLGNNRITDITALQSLNNLTELALHSNQITDIAALQSLNNLTELALYSNQISDITPLQSLTNLTWLSLFNNQISDITALHSLKNLTELYMSNNQISDITVLQSLTNLTILDLRSNQTSDITSLQSLANLTSLSLDNNNISDITPLQVLTNLTFLGLGNNQINDITTLRSLENITELYMNNNQISDITVLQSLTKLTELYLAINQISDITPLQSLANLTSLDLASNQISDITALQSLANLTTLDLTFNQISEIMPLTSLVGLDLLFIDLNPLTDDQILELQLLLPKCIIY